MKINTFDNKCTMNATEQKVHVKGDGGGNKTENIV